MTTDAKSKPEQFNKLMTLLSLTNNGTPPLGRFSHSSRVISVVFYGIASLIKQIPPSRILTISGPRVFRGKGHITIKARLSTFETIKCMMEKLTVLSYRTPNPKESLHNLQNRIGLDKDCTTECTLSDNDALVFFGKRDGCPAVSHVGFERLGHAAISRHSEGLSLASSVISGERSISIPVLLFSQDSEELSVSVQTRLPGTALLQGIGDSDELLQAVEAAFKAHSQCLAQHSTTSPVSEIKFLQDSTSILLGHLPNEDAPNVQQAARALASWIDHKKPKGLLVHGDYWLNNIMVTLSATQENGEVAGLIDWEWARPEGLPLYDLLHLVVMSNAAFHKQHVGQLIAKVWEGSTGDLIGWNLLERAAKDLGYTQTDVGYIAISLWLRYLWQGHVLTYSGGQPWLENMLARSLEAIEIWLRSHGQKGNDN